MKPNRSNQRTNLVAGTWMPLTLTLLALALVGPSQLHAGQEADKDLAIRTGVSMSSKILKNSSSQLHELSVVAATQAIKDGSLTAVAYATALLRRYHDHADLNAFITVNNDAVLEASSVADSDRKTGKRLAAPRRSDRCQRQHQHT